MDYQLIFTSIIGIVAFSYLCIKIIILFKNKKYGNTCGDCDVIDNK